MWHRLRSLVLLGPIWIALTACPGPTEGPDLISERRPDGNGAEGYCRKEGGTTLIVRVRNQTNVGVLTPTSTTVLFSPGGTVSQSTPPLAGGASADASFSIPSVCHDPDCDFTITVDAEKQVEETLEVNNTAIGICIG